MSDTNSGKSLVLN